MATGRHHAVAVHAVWPGQSMRVVELCVVNLRNEHPAELRREQLEAEDA